jgi:tRNA (guanine6-N2)-methyltransferase
MNYFARVTAGLERLAWQEIEQRTGATLTALDKRRVDFSYDGDPAILLTLRSIDDVYVYVAQFHSIDHTRHSLPLLAKNMQEVDFTPALKICAMVRHIPSHPGYSITPSLLGKRNYSRYDVEEVVQEALSRRLSWRFIPNRANEEQSHEIDLRLLLEDENVIVGVRLGEIPLHRRDYKVESVPGSLKAPVAFCMCLLADVSSDAVVIDPMCGAGTILREARTLATRGIIIGGDVDEHALEAAQKNTAVEVPARSQPLPGFFTDAQQLAAAIASARSRQEEALLLYRGDASTLPLPASSVQAVITNAPWGQQVSPHVDLAALYTRLVNEIERVLTPPGKAVVLTDQHSFFQEALTRAGNLSLTTTWQISLFGRHPALYVISK